jgi:hypothetical protein
MNMVISSLQTPQGWDLNVGKNVKSVSNTRFRYFEYHLLRTILANSML